MWVITSTNNGPYQMQKRQKVITQKKDVFKNHVDIW